MKTQTQLLAATLVAVFSLVPARGQNFDCGSNGSLGALSVTDADVTVDLPPDGRLHYTTVNVAAGRTLRFNRNALNTPGYLLAQGDVVINGTVDVSGQQAPGNPPIGGAGGPGGFDGGKPGFGPEFPPGDGYGPGAGGGGERGRHGAAAGGGGYGRPGHSSDSNFKGKSYGSPLLIPLMGGSGGGGVSGTPGDGGGGGGGAILIASNTRIIVNSGGRVVADGGAGRALFTPHGGSGGAVRLLAPRVEGQGTVRARGGGEGGGDGRIRVDCFDKTALQLNFEPRDLTTVGANMFVEPPVVPRLDIVNAAGTDIPLGTGNTVRILLPFGSDTNRTVTLRAQDFNAEVPVQLVLTPDSGPRTIIETNLVNTADQNPATLVVPITLPVNNLVTIQAWTR